MSTLTPEELQERYALLCNASQPNSQLQQHYADALTQLEDLINHDFIELTRQGCPDNIADILKAFNNELVRFRQFCEFPALATKSIVGIGGGFSAGKSSFINKLINKKCLAVEIDPTTSMPAYVLHAPQEEVKAINAHNCAIDITPAQFATLTHEEKQKYGSQVGLLLKSAFITLPSFEWQNLALLDTPGYSKPEKYNANQRTDENLARAQLNTADYIVWLVPADDGTITENDIKFLSTLDKDIPKLVVLSKADKKTEQEVQEITQLISETLANRGIKILDTVAYSRRGNKYPLDTVKAHFTNWDQTKNPVLFAQHFKALFVQFQEHIEAQLRHIHLRKDKINRILVLSESEDINHEANILMTNINQKLAKITAQKDALAQLNLQFFTQLKALGDLTGVPLPEPDALALLSLKKINLLTMLSSLRAAKKCPAPEVDKFAPFTLAPCSDQQASTLLRQTPSINPIEATSPETHTLASMLRHTPSINPINIVINE